jgi:hypothetical protein
MFIEGKYLNFSIVLAASSNNPTILNPDFLKYNKIVDDSYELKQHPICTEPFSQLIFKNGVSITSQLDKIVFSIDKISKNADDFSKIYHISKNYLECISHVNYKAIGINPKYFLKLEENQPPQEYIISRFMKGDIFKRPLSRIEFKLSFDVNNDTKCHLTVSTGEIKEETEKHKVVLVGANFHHELPQDLFKKISFMKKVLDSYMDDISVFYGILSNYFYEV